MKVCFIGIFCEDYIIDKVVNVDIFEKLNEVFENIELDLIDCIYLFREGLDISEFDFKDIICFNECFILKSDCSSVFVCYNFFIYMVCWVNKIKNYGIEFCNVEQSFVFEILNDLDIKLVVLIGKVGIGKILFVLVVVLGKFMEYKQILLVCFIVVFFNKDLGFFLGDVIEKVVFYM